VRVPSAGHDLDAFTALATARAMGATVRVTLVGCEPESFGTEDGGDGRMGLSPRVAAAVEPAVDLVLSLTRAHENATKGRRKHEKA
jgi:hydrogenase maturation protease